MESVFLFVYVFTLPLVVATLLIILWEIKKVQRGLLQPQKSLLKGRDEAEEDFAPAFSMIKKEYSLTDREIEILMELFAGNGNRVIAGKLYISENTVKTHIHNLLQKMGTASRVEAINMVRSTMTEVVPGNGKSTISAVN